MGEREILTINRTGDNMRRWSLTEPGVTEGRWSAFIMPGGDELILYDEKDRKLHRYELPSFGATSKQVPTSGSGCGAVLCAWAAAVKSLREIPGCKLASLLRFRLNGSSDNDGVAPQHSRC